MKPRDCLICCLVLAGGAPLFGQPPSDEAGLVRSRFSSRTQTASPDRGPFLDGHFTLAAGETVVFVGPANVVESQWNGQLEALLALAFPGSRSRNLAWEGDTVFQQPRDLNFGSWAEQLDHVRASVVIAQFGQLEALTASASTPAAQLESNVTEFRDAYEGLLDQFAAQTRRIVLVAPPPFEAAQSALLPNLSRHNALLEQYTAAIAELAQQRRFIFVDLYHAFQDEPSPTALTNDGLQLTPAGQTAVANAVAKSLGLPERSPQEIIELRTAIRYNNRLWFNYWRPRNWAFLWGDRTTQPFSKHWQSGEPRLFPTEMEQYPPLIEAAEKEIQQQVLRLKRSK